MRKAAQLHRFAARECIGNFSETLIDQRGAFGARQRSQRPIDGFSQFDAGNGPLCHHRPLR